MILRSAKQLHDQVRNWNKQVPVGTLVRVNTAKGPVINSRTASEAFVHGQSPVINLTDVPGVYLLDRVEVADGDN